MAGRRQQPRKTADLAAAADPLVTGGEDAASENLLIFQLAGEPFALRLASVAEIIRLPGLAHMPLVPPSLLGLANLRGIVLPVISLRALLQLPGIEANEQTRVIVMRGDAAVGFVVDQVDRLLALAAHQLEHDDAGAGTTDPALARWHHQGIGRPEHDQAIESIAAVERAIRPARRLHDARREPGRRSQSAARLRRRPRRWFRC